MAIARPLIFIDWHGTLSDSVFWHSFRAGSPHERYLRERMDEEIFSKSGTDNQPYRSPEAWDKGAQTSEAYVQFVADVVGEPFELMWMRFVADCKTYAIDTQDYLDQIEKLQMVGKVVLATDQGEAFHRFVWPHMNMENVFDDLLISSQIGATKHEPEHFFASYFDQVTNGNAIIIDDSKDVCEHFCKIGGYAIQVTPATPTSVALDEALKWAEQKLYAS